MFLTGAGEGPGHADGSKSHPPRGARGKTGTMRWVDDRTSLAPRRTVGACLFDALLRAVSRVGRLHPDAALARHGVEQEANVPYLGSESNDHLLDVFRPADATSPPRFRRYHGPPWPIVLYVHGGGFANLSKDTHWLMALAFARRGFVVFNIGYRLAPKHRYPAAIEDVCRAFSWVIANAGRYGGDTSRVVLAGESAGANLVTSLAVALAYERPEPFAREAFATGISPRAVLPACGVFQVTDILRLKRRKPRMSSFIVDRLLEVEHAYLGSGPHAGPLDLADPLLVIERGDSPARPLPPFFLPVGTKDPLLPDTRRLAEALRRLGVEAEEAYYPGELHAFHALVTRAPARRCWADTFRFLDRHVPQPAADE